MTEDRDQIFKFGPFSLDPEQRLLSSGGKAIRYVTRNNGKLDKLAGRTFDLLRTLVENSGRTMSKSELLDAVWPKKDVSESALAQAIATLRKCFGDDPKNPEYIETVPGEGYYFKKEVERVRREGIVGAKSTPRPEQTEKPKKPKPVIAIPWGTSLDPDSRRLGMISAITRRLDKIDSITTKIIFAAEFREWFEAARKLDADYVLVPIVREDQGVMHVGAQLLTEADRRQVWVYERKEIIMDIFDLEERIATRLTDSLQLKFTEQERRRMSVRYTENREAYTAYQQGRGLWEQMSPRALQEQAWVYFELAQSLDEDYVKPLIGKADILIWAAVYGRIEPSGAFDEAERLAGQALKMEKDLPGAHCALAFTRFFHHQFAEADVKFKRAIELNPYYSNAYQGYGLLLMVQRKFQEALAMLKKAIQLKPMRFLNYAILGIINYECENEKEAIAALDECKKLNDKFDAAFFGLALVHTRLRNYKEALEYAREALNLSDHSTLNQALLAYIYAVSGQPEEGRQAADNLSAGFEQRYVSPFHLSLVYAELGDRELAGRWMKMAQDKDPWYLLRETDVRLRNFPYLHTI